MTKVTKVASRIAVCVGLSITLLGAGIARAVPISDLPDFSPLIPYTTFGNDTFLNLATINGNAGISANGTFKMSAPSVINGRLDEDSGVTNSIDSGATITGGIHMGVDLSAAQALVFSASTTLAGLTPSTTLGAVNVPAGGVSFGSLDGIADVNVINMTSLTSGNGNISLVGDPGDFWVLNISGALSLTGSAAIGSLSQASHTFINLDDNSGTDLGTVAHINNVINGMVLIPFDDATFHSMNGATWSGNGMITFMSGATIQGIPEAPTTSLLAFGGLLAIGVALRRRSTAKA
jgi:hypothetical protein